MTPEGILALSAMPATNPSYPPVPYRFTARETLIIAYESDPVAIREAVPEPLEPDGSDRVLYEWIRMPAESRGSSDGGAEMVIATAFEQIVQGRRSAILKGGLEPTSPRDSCRSLGIHHALEASP